MFTQPPLSLDINVQVFEYRFMIVVKVVDEFSLLVAVENS